MDLQNLFLLIEPGAHFKDETCITTINQPNKQVPFLRRNKEKWKSKETHHTVRKCIDLVENDEKTNVTLNSKLTIKKHIAMKELPKRKDLIITNAEKCGVVVIMDTESFIKGANWQLSDKTSYKQITQNPTSQHKRMVTQTLDMFKNKNYILKKLNMVKK